MGAGTSIDGPTCDATKHRSRNGSRVGPGNCTNGEHTLKTEPFEFDCLAARFLRSGLHAVDPHHVVVPIAGLECLERRRGLLAETGQDRQADNASVPRRCYPSASGRDTQHWFVTSVLGAIGITGGQKRSA